MHKYMYLVCVNLYSTPPPEIHWGVNTKSEKKKALSQSSQNSPGTITTMALIRHSDSVQS